MKDFDLGIVDCNTRVVTGVVTETGPLIINAVCVDPSGTTAWFAAWNPPPPFTFSTSSLYLIDDLAAGSATLLPPSIGGIIGNLIYDDGRNLLHEFDGGNQVLRSFTQSLDLDSPLAIRERSTARRSSGRSAPSAAAPRRPPAPATAPRARRADPRRANLR